MIHALNVYNIDIKLGNCLDNVAKSSKTLTLFVEGSDHLYYY